MHRLSEVASDDEEAIAFALVCQGGLSPLA
jgi:hypothetical protein